MRGFGIGLAIMLLFAGIGCGSTNEPTIKSSEAFWTENRTRQPITLNTTRGAITIELYLKESAVASAVVLRAAELGFYDGREFLGKRQEERRDFYEIVPLKLSRKEWKALYKDITRGVVELPFRRGSVGMIARGEDVRRNSSGGFFICTRVNQEFNLLNGRFTPVGQVVSGMDVVDLLKAGDKILSVQAPKLDDILNRKFVDSMEIISKE